MEQVCNRKFGGILKGSMISLIVTLIGILLFAFVLKFIEIGDGFISPINQIIKIVSIFIGVKLMLKDCKEKGFLKGLILGLVYTLLAYVVFALLSRSFIFDLTSITDFVFGGIMGGICGVILVNSRK